MANVKIFFKKSPEYRTVTTTGVWGGITPQGLLCCDLFMERQESPESVTIEVNEQTGVAQEVDRQPRQSMMVRESMVGLVLTPEAAHSIGTWLVRNAEEFDRHHRSGGSGPVQG